MPLRSQTRLRLRLEGSHFTLLTAIPNNTSKLSKVCLFRSVSALFLEVARGERRMDLYLFHPVAILREFQPAGAVPFSAVISASTIKNARAITNLISPHLTLSLCSLRHSPCDASSFPKFPSFPSFSIISHVQPDLSENNVGNVQPALRAASTKRWKRVIVCSVIIKLTETKDGHKSRQSSWRICQESGFCPYYPQTG